MTPRRHWGTPSQCHLSSAWVPSEHSSMTQSVQLNIYATVQTRWWTWSLLYPVEGQTNLQLGSTPATLMWIHMKLWFVLVILVHGMHLLSAYHNPKVYILEGFLLFLYRLTAFTQWRIQNLRSISYMHLQKWVVTSGTAFREILLHEANMLLM